MTMHAVPVSKIESERQRKMALEEKIKASGDMSRHNRSGRRAAMQIVREVNPQSICEDLLASDTGVIYSSYLDSEGRRTAEATKNVIGLYDELTVMVLPLHPDKGALVLAVPIGSDLPETITKVKKVFFAKS